MNSSNDIERFPLYKYYGLSRPESLHRFIVSSEAYFPSIDDFNDPFDGQVVPIFEATEQQRIDFAANLQRIEHGSVDPIKCQAFVDRLNSKEGKELLPKAVRQALSQQGMLSLTTHPDDMLMWSHYAAGHTGIAVRFDPAIHDISMSDKSFQLMKVDYREEYPQINIFEINSGNIDAIDRTAKTKSSAWKYEDEWRLVALGSARRCVKIPETLVTGLVFGLRTPDWFRDAVFQWNGKRAQPLELLQVRNKPHSFALQVVPVGS